MRFCHISAMGSSNNLSVAARSSRRSVILSFYKFMLLPGSSNLKCELSPSVGVKSAPKMLQLCSYHSEPEFECSGIDGNCARMRTRSLKSETQPDAAELLTAQSFDNSTTLTIASKQGQGALLTIVSMAS